MEEGLDDFFEGIRMALDPLVTFGVKIVPEKEIEKSQNFLWQDFRKLANKLIQRELTGHAARDAIITAMESATKEEWNGCLLYTSPSPRDMTGSRMPSSA